MFGIDPYVLVGAWIVLTIIVAALGSERQIGGAVALFISLFFSPLIGIIVTYLTPSKKDVQTLKDIRYYLSNINFMYSEVHNYETTDAPTGEGEPAE